MKDRQFVRGGRSWRIVFGFEERRRGRAARRRARWRAARRYRPVPGFVPLMVLSAAMPVAGKGVGRVCRGWR